MENLSKLELRFAYHKGEHNIAREFYLPCMSRAVAYDRAVGFFSSTIYIIAWSSLKDFVQRGGKIRVICSPVLAPEDITALDEGYTARIFERAKESLRHEVEQLLTDAYLQKPARVLASLVALGVIDLHIAFVGDKSSPQHRRLFHDKVGIFTDEEANSVVFKGSMNETWAGLSLDGNLESVDVYVSWEGRRDKARVENEVEYFDRLWNNQYPTVYVSEFPDVAKEMLVSAADTKNWPTLVDDICTEIERASILSAERKPNGRVPKPHQVHALQAWFNQERRGIFEHATGSGKTFTALCAIRESLTRGETPVILVPSQLLFTQWHEEVRDVFADLDPQLLLCGAGHTRWRRDHLLARWTKQSNRARLVIATMQTAAQDEFLTAIQQGKHVFLVADEVHRLGSPEHRKLLSLDTGPRLGLSATPRRAGDPIGTAAIFEYFNGVVPPPFTLRDAIRARALVPYMYSPHEVYLSEQEQQSWDEVTERIQQLYARQQASDQRNSSLEERMKRLLIKRARILKGATAKVPLARDVLLRYFRQGQRWIVYCDTQQQLREVLDELRSSALDALEYHSAMLGDRDHTLHHFELNGGILVSIRCLDEGVDIPSVSHALILASSKNPREYIQRRGRVLRKAPNKTLAYIHDAIVLPNRLDNDVLGASIVEGELARAVEFGEGAENPGAVTDLKRLALRFDLDYQALVQEGVEDDE